MTPKYKLNYEFSNGNYDDYSSNNLEEIKSILNEISHADNFERAEIIEHDFYNGQVIDVKCIYSTNTGWNYEERNNY